MRIAVISDIHSNIYALEKVLEDIERRDVDLTVCLGDLVGYGTHPNEVIELIRKKNILTIMGNYDDAVGFERMVCGCDYPNPKDAENAGISLGWTVENTTEENKRFLRALPKEAVLTFGERTFIFVHGSPRKINEYLKENSKEAEEVMGEISHDILVCGHTHVPYFKRYYNKMLINSGSVGKPKNGRPDANYIIIDADDELKVEIMYVPYDYERAAQDMEEVGMPESFINNIRTGRA